MLLIPLVYFLFATATMVVLTRQKFGKCLPLVMMLSAFSLYFSQFIFQTFSVGFWLNIVFAITPIPLLVIYRKDWKFFKQNFFTTGLIIFIVAFLAVALYDFNRVFIRYDERMHWGPMLKEMLRLDKFYTVDASHLMVHKDYPPIMQLFETFWLKLCGSFSEARAEQAMHTFELSLVIPFLSEELSIRKKSVKHIIRNLVTLMSIVVIVLFLDQHAVIHTIYVDYCLAITVVYLLLTIVFRKQNTKKPDLFLYSELIIGLSFLVLMKQTGLPFYLLVLVFFVIDTLAIRRYKELPKHDNIYTLITIAVVAIIPILTWFEWNQYIKDQPQQFKISDLSITELPGILSGVQGEEWQQTTSRNFLTALWKENITSSWLSLPYVPCIIIGLILVFLAYRASRKHIKKLRIAYLGAILLLSSIAYAFMMLILYVFSFGPNEGPSLASYNRYMSTYIIILWVVPILILTFSSIKDAKSSPKVIYIMLAVALLVNSPSSYTRLAPAIHKHSKFTFQVTAEELAKAMPKEEASVFVEAQDMRAFLIFMQYYAITLKMNIAQYSLPVGDNVAPEEYFNERVKPEMLQYEYFFVCNTTPEFLQAYGTLYPTDTKIENGNLYAISNDADNFKLEYFTNVSPACK